MVALDLSDTLFFKCSNDCPIVVLDACVLYPAGLRSLMMWLAVHELIRSKWTEQIHEEWMRNLLIDRPDLSRAQLERTRRLMDQHGGDCLVCGHEKHTAKLTLPDVNDRHVLAAAIECKADAIVTWNQGDFPKKTVAATASRFAPLMNSSGRCSTHTQPWCWQRCEIIGQV